LAKIRGASKVYLAGTRDYRLKFGPQFGADVMTNVQKDNVVDIIRKDTRGRGVDVVIEAAGSEKAFNDGLSVLAKGGIFLLYGVFGGAISIDGQPIQMYEFSVIGSASVDYTPAIKLIDNGSVGAKDLISHEFTLEKLPEAFSSGLIEKRLENYMKGVVLF